MNNSEKKLLLGRKNVYIYAEVDIDKAYYEITGKSKKIKSFLESKKLGYEFTENLRLYKNFVLGMLLVENLF